MYKIYFYMTLIALPLSVFSSGNKAIVESESDCTLSEYILLEDTDSNIEQLNKRIAQLQTERQQILEQQKEKEKIASQLQTDIDKFKQEFAQAQKSALSSIEQEKEIMTQKVAYIEQLYTTEIERLKSQEQALRQDWEERFTQHGKRMAELQKTILQDKRAAEAYHKNFIGVLLSLYKAEGKKSNTINLQELITKAESKVATASKAKKN